MTQAVCFNCGAIKWGAFNDCDHCNAHPSTDDELMISLALTDHYFDLAALKQTGQAIKAGRRPTLPEDIKNKLRPEIIEFKRMVGGVINSERDTTRKQKKAPSLLETFSQKFAGLFTRTTAPSVIPLTDFCIHLSNIATTDHLLPYLRKVVAKVHTTEMEKRAVVLSILTMALAGHFVDDLRSNKDAMYRDVREFFQETNFDAITADAIVWTLWLFRMCWTGDPNRFANEPFDQIDDHTFVLSARYANLLIHKKTGIDFTARATEGGRFYSQMIRSEPPHCLAEGFATRLMQVVGNQTFDNSYKPITASLMLSEAWTPLNIVVMLFFTTMPSGSYETFKNILKHWSDLGFNDA